MNTLLDLKFLRQVCTAKTEYFKQYGAAQDTLWGELIYKDNGSNILAVGHLDSVRRGFCTIVNHENTRLVFSPSLDDRLGVYIILDLLPKLNITVDYLLTTDEEKIQSTAQFFNNTRQYNWIVEFDRAGTDVVSYQYESRKFNALLRKAGFRLSIGSYTDICELEYLKCKAFNVGIGYKDNHEINAYANLGDTMTQLARFCVFYSKFKDTYLPHSPTHRRKISSSITTDGLTLSTLDSGSGLPAYYSRYKYPLANDIWRCTECQIELIYQREFDLGLCDDCMHRISHSEDD